MKKILIFALALSVMTFASGCKKADNKADDTKDAPTSAEVVQADGAEQEVPSSETGNTADESSEKIDVSDVEAPEDISDTATLEALIEEFNDPNTSPERRAELQILLGDFFDMMEGETVVLSE